MFSALRDWLRARFRTKSFGERGEEAAARFLKRQGYHILGRQVHTKGGEIDLVAVEGRTVVFIEVKTRRSTDAGHPADAVDPNKQRRLTGAALAYLKANGLLEYASRFDVVAVMWCGESSTPSIEHYRDAFPAVGAGQFFG
jgi:putative endonuclease